MLVSERIAIVKLYNRYATALPASFRCGELVGVLQQFVNRKGRRGVTATTRGIRVRVGIAPRLFEFFHLGTSRHDGVECQVELDIQCPHLSGHFPLPLTLLVFANFDGINLEG